MFEDPANYIIKYKISTLDNFHFYSNKAPATNLTSLSPQFPFVTKFLCQEDELRSKPKHEHLLEELHVLIEVEGAPGVAEARFQAAAAEIKHICLPVVSIVFENI